VKNTPNLLNVHQVSHLLLGLYQEPFDEVTELSGMVLTPSKKNPLVWKFEKKRGGTQGLLMDVAGHLLNQPIQFGTGVTAYLSKQKGLVYGLVLPGTAFTLSMKERKNKPIPFEPDMVAPHVIQPNAVDMVIRYKLRKVFVLNERHLFSVVSR